MREDWTWWRAALTGARPPLHENEPQPGYYRMRRGRGSPWWPVAIWREPDGSLKALCDGAAADAQDLWTWCCSHPVTYETYRAVAEDGAAWPDEVLPGLGHNKGPALPAPLHEPDAEPSPAVLLAAIAGLREVAETWLADLGSITVQMQADRAANFAERFAALETQAEEARQAEKRPVLAQGRAIDAAWKPVVEAAASAKSRMKAALQPFLVAEQERLQAEAVASGQDVSGDKAPRAGTSGRRVGLRRERRLVVRDREALVRSYRRQPRFWAHEGVTKALLDLAEADLRAGHRVDGAELVDTVVAA